MGTNSKIEWTDHTWNPWRGCTKVSPACDNCYMFRESSRYGFNPAEVIRTSIMTFRAPLTFHGTPHVPMQADSRRRREKLHKWADGDKVFVCSWSDFFHPDAYAWRGEAWEIIRQRPGLIFQILTKRPERIHECLPANWGGGWPNVWLGVTAEDQEQADKRIPLLLSVPAAKRFVSIEPMLGEIRLEPYVQIFETNTQPEHFEQYGWRYDEWSGGFVGPGSVEPIYEPKAGLDWVIVGGESGPNARPLHPDWVRTIRDQCQEAKVPFMFKQWGEWLPKSQGGKYQQHTAWGTLSHNGGFFNEATTWNGRQEDGEDRECSVFRVGRTAAGCLLDGRAWKEFPVEDGVNV